MVAPGHSPRRSARALTPRDTMGSVAPDEAQETADALMFMADEFVRDDCPLQAVKCYEAICDKNNLTPHAAASPGAPAVATAASGRYTRSSAASAATGSSFFKHSSISIF